MRRIASVFLAVTVGVGTLTGAPVLAQMDSQLQEDAAQRAAEAWLALVDKGEYDASWDQAATFFQRSVTRDAWRQDVAGLRDPGGKLVSRKFSIRQYNERLPGAPVGQYVVISYRSTFKDRKGIREIVTAAFDGARGWRAAGYKIEGFRRWVHLDSAEGVGFDSPPSQNEVQLELVEPSLLLLHEDVGENYDAVAKSAAAAVGAESCQLALYDADTDELIARRPSYAAAPRSIPQYRFPIAQAPASAHVVRTGEPYLSNDPAADPLYDASIKDRGVNAVLTVPVRHAGRILGLLYAVNKPGGFSSDDARTLTALAGAAAITIANIRLYVEERDRRVLSESLRDVSRALVGTLSEQSALSAVLDQMWRVVRYQAAVAVVADGPVLGVAASRGGDPEGEVRLDEAGDLRAVFLTRKTTVLSDAATRLPRLGLRGMNGHCLAAPLLTRDEVRGAIIVLFDTDHAPGPRDERIVTAFADHAALFLEAGALLRKERRARTRATAVARITRMAASRHEPESLLQAVAPELLAASGADRVILYLKPTRGALLTPVAWAGTTPEEEEKIAGETLEPSSAVVAALLKGAPMLFQEPDNLAPAHVHPFAQAASLLIVPLAVRDQLLGAVSLVCLRHYVHFDGPAIEFLGDVAQQVALGVENARLFLALSQMASTDELTQLANRRRFTEALRRELGRARRTGLSLSLVLVDVDHLKKVNDTFGHPAGDSAIRHVAGALKEGRRDTDVVARFGGEEFALLLPGTDHVGAVKAAERVRVRLSTTVVETVGQVTASMGVSTWPEDGATEERLVWVADQRLYEAKEGGRNRVSGGPLVEPSSEPGPA